MFALLIANRFTLETKPVFFAICSLHAREYSPAELCTRFAEKLVSGYGNDPDITTLVDYHEIHLVLQGNPDGRKMAEAGYLWRKNKNNRYCSDKNVDAKGYAKGRGIDLNRNFPVGFGIEDGSEECDLTFHGPAAYPSPRVER